MTDIGIGKLDNRILKTANVLKTLGHPVRVEILRLISNSKSNKLSVTEIHEHLGITQPETSKHLVLLKNISVLLCDRKAGYSYYRLNNEYPFIHGIINHVNKK